MNKREGAMLAMSYEGQSIGGWFASVKLDGQRAIWDGGISTGLPVEKVPYAFLPKKGMIATGLWSRNFKAICAPADFVSKLPKGRPLDGELWCGNGEFEKLESIVRTESDAKAEDWKDVQYKCFDAPAYSSLFAEGQLYIRKQYHPIDCWRWVCTRIADLGFKISNPQAFEFALRCIPEEFRHEQVQLPLREEDAVEAMYNQLSMITDAGGEGIMLRRGMSIWQPKRVKDLLKVKKFFDDEAVVRGYAEGDGRLKGVLGALLLEGEVPTKLGGLEKVTRRFKISGFTDEERKNAQTLFPVGTQISYRYNELTDLGYPRFARFWRKRTEE